MTPELHNCFVCGAASQMAVDLPALPLTDSYGARPPRTSENGIDQQLLLCPRCGHGQLAVLLPPDVLYGGDYSFRTSASHSSSAGCEFFLDFLDRLMPGRQFRCVLDVGCNDLYLLRRLQSRAQYRVGIDPVLAGREGEYSGADMVVVGSTFERADLDALLPGRADLIVARHTLEHMQRPVETVRRMLDYVDAEGVVLIEVPGFHTLVGRRRYDQVFHQHIQYFSRSSMMQLLVEADAELLGITENYHHWGATLVAFRRARGAPRSIVEAEPRFSQIVNGYREFRQALETIAPLLASLGGPTYGYGAAQMLPVLAYHMGTDLSCLSAVLDDDPSKDGLGYWNLPVKVQTRDPDMDLSAASVLITAVDNAAPIMRRLLEHRPKHIVNPFPVI